MENDEPFFTCPECGETDTALNFYGTENLSTTGTARIHSNRDGAPNYYVTEDVDDSDTVDSEVHYYQCRSCDHEMESIDEYITTPPRQGSQAERTPTEIRNISESRRIIDPEKETSPYKAGNAYTGLPGNTNVAECPECANSFSIRNVSSSDKITCTNPDCDREFTLAEIIKNQNAYDTTPDVRSTYDSASRRIPTSGIPLVSTDDLFTYIIRGDND